VQTNNETNKMQTNGEVRGLGGVAIVIGAVVCCAHSRSGAARTTNVNKLSTSTTITTTNTRTTIGMQTSSAARFEAQKVNRKAKPLSKNDSPSSLRAGGVGQRRRRRRRHCQSQQVRNVSFALFVVIVVDEWLQ
jgi:hypothetical protein